MKNLIVLFAACCALTLVKASTYEVSRLSDQQLDETDRIINAHPIARGQLPHLVVIFNPIGEGYTFCPGVLISHRWVITNADCASFGDALQVHLGIQNVSDWSQEGRVIRPATLRIVHPNYNPTLKQNDIALLRLDTAVQNTELIRPIRLPKRGNLYNQVSAISSGFSQVNGVFAETLQWAQFVTINNAECVARLGTSEGPFAAQTSVICAVGRNAASPCASDMGSPLTTQDRRLIGIASFVSQRGCHHGYPVIFTRVTSYLDWIAAVIRNNP